MRGLLYGISGGILSFILLSIFEKLMNGMGEIEVIFSGIIVMSIIICGCTGILVQTHKDNKIK
ncbi:hypothetical protein JHL18_22295 [Clostridium sp. YIM B02505]|uniref:Uncharacterized protein n=1 Tax=Clostridium yunnanense TaxID=2800325 RepID=A0ABS1EVE0_9CLOT|nr:hypothetical protein [Clostridium yunnanense]MBK1813357.1 hypothetical protein [Clostridium yunnanense]